jgi:hypothetical protein
VLKTLSSVSPAGLRCMIVMDREEMVLLKLGLCVDGVYLGRIVVSVRRLVE